MKKALLVIILLAIMLLSACYNTDQLFETEVFITQITIHEGIENSLNSQYREDFAYISTGTELSFKVMDYNEQFEVGKAYKVVLRRTKNGGWELEKVK